MRLVICNKEGKYGYTDTRTLCMVTLEDPFTVRVVSRYGRNLEFDVDREDFVDITVEEYMARFPGVEIYWDLIQTEPIKVEVPETQMKLGDAYVPTEEELYALVNECTKLLEEYDYSPTDSGVTKFLNEYFGNKGPLINVFRNHPNYNGKYQIAFDQDYGRELDVNDIIAYGDWIYEIKGEVKEVVIDGLGYEDIAFESRSFLGLSKEKREEVKGKFFDMKENGELIIRNYSAYLKEPYERFMECTRYADLIWNTRRTTIDENDADNINEKFPKAKAVAGAKTSRVMNKIAKLIGIDKHEEYNKRFAKYSDALNPLRIVRHTVLSLHPVDYLTMSFGNSWSSCHTIDKQNRRGMPHSYEGCYSAGTMSYMMDESSMVFYTVDGSYSGNELELQPKITRCMFHIGNDKVVQARMYPQSTDGNKDVYSEVREIVQRVIAECFDVPNFWSNEKGTDECERVIGTFGAHYRDYLNFSYCNVSYLKNSEGKRNYTKIKVGHNPICPSCGKEHRDPNCIECVDCSKVGYHTCYECGEEFDEEDMYYINGEWYCCECSTYCDYHGEREVGNEDDFYYVSGYGYICEDARNSGDFSSCENCGDIDLISYGIMAEDGTWFCCSGCAEEEGYVEVGDGVWVHKDKVIECKECGAIVLAEDAESGMCKDCAEEKEVA